MKRLLLSRVRRRGVAGRPAEEQVVRATGEAGPPKTPYDVTSETKTSEGGLVGDVETVSVQTYKEAQETNVWSGIGDVASWVWEALRDNEGTVLKCSSASTHTQKKTRKKLKFIHKRGATPTHHWIKQ